MERLGADGRGFSLLGEKDRVGVLLSLLKERNPEPILGAVERVELRIPLPLSLPKSRSLPGFARLPSRRPPNVRGAPGACPKLRVDTPLPLWRPPNVRLPLPVDWLKFPWLCVLPNSVIRVPLPKSPRSKPSRMPIRRIPLGCVPPYCLP